MTRAFLFAFLLTLSGSAFGLDIETSRLVEVARTGNADDMYKAFFAIISKSTVKHPVTKEDEKLARYWLIEAGEHNSIKAAYILQTAYKTGWLGVPIDQKKALHYKELAKKFPK